MYKIIAIFLIFCQLTIAEEINIPAYAEALQTEIQESAVTDREIANDFKKFNKPTLQQTLGMVRATKESIANGFSDLVDELNAVVAVLDKFKNSNVEGNVYFPEDLFDEIRNGALGLAQGFANAANLSRIQIEEIEKNAHFFQVNSAGYFTLSPRGIGSTLIKDRTALSKTFASLARTCLDTQIALTQAANLLVIAGNKKGAALFNLAVEVFQQGIQDFSKIAGFMLDLVKGYEGFGVGNPSHSVYISGDKFIRVFNNVMQNIGKEYSVIADQAEAL